MFLYFIECCHTTTIQGPIDMHAFEGVRFGVADSIHWRVRSSHSGIRLFFCCFVIAQKHFSLWDMSLKAPKKGKKRQETDDADEEPVSKVVRLAHHRDAGLTKLKANQRRLPSTYTQTS